MNDIDELKRFAVAHARAQALPRTLYREVLGRIHTDEPDGTGSWVREWSNAAARAEREGKRLLAARLFNMARFPYADSDSRRDALDRCVAVFDRWRAETPITPLEVRMDGGRVRCWTIGLTSGEPKLPVVLMLGGIVSIKEQWAPALLQMRRMGLAGVVTELPSVGSNTMRYGPDSWRMLSTLIDAIRGRADLARTYALAVSFSGNMALRCASDDDRIAGVVTAGVPVRAFFTDESWQRQLPRITLDTLAHVCGQQPGQVFGWLREMALTTALLSTVRVPVYCMVSSRDEIVPRADVTALHEGLGDLRLIEHDDVHGAPRHVLDTRLWVVRSLLELRGGRVPQRTVLSGLQLALRLARSCDPMRRHLA